MALLWLPACAPALTQEAGTCGAARSEADFTSVSRRLRRQLEGELRLHALSPSAIEALSGEPVGANPLAILWSFRFTPSGAPFPMGQVPRLPIEDDRRYPDLLVVTRERVYGSAPGDRGVRRDERGIVGIGQLVPIPSDEDGAERVEITMRAAMHWPHALDGPNGPPPACPATLRVTLPLPPGGALWDRLNRTFLQGPLSLRSGALGARPATPAVAAAPPGTDLAEVACAAGESEGCYAAAQTLRASGAKRHAAPGAGGSARGGGTQRPVSQDQLERAEAFVRRACDLGHGPACGVYGQILGDRATLGGEARGAAGAPRRRALDALRRACDLDFGDGCAELAADAQRHGDGALAKRLFSLGCTLGSQAACEGRAARRRDPQTLRRIADELLGDKPPARKRGGPS